MLDMLVCKVQGSSCLCFPSAWVIGVDHFGQLFSWVLGIELESLCLCGKIFYQLNHFLSLYMFHFKLIFMLLPREIMILHRGVCHDMNLVSYLAPEEHSFLCFTIFSVCFWLNRRQGYWRR